MSDYYFIIASVLSIVGAALASSKREKLRFWGFLIWIISNGMIAYSYYTMTIFPMMGTFIIYEVFNVRGVINNRYWINNVSKIISEVKTKKYRPLQQIF